jgi:hypothetical protein
LPQVHHTIHTPCRSRNGTCSSSPVPVGDAGFGIIQLSILIDRPTSTLPIGRHGLQTRQAAVLASRRLVRFLDETDNHMEREPEVSFQRSGRTGHFRHAKAEFGLSSTARSTISVAVSESPEK